MLAGRRATKLLREIADFILIGAATLQVRYIDNREGARAWLGTA